MKKILCVLLLLIMVLGIFAFTACGKETEAELLANDIFGGGIITGYDKDGKDMIIVDAKDVFSDIFSGNANEKLENVKVETIQLNVEAMGELTNIIITFDKTFSGEVSAYYLNNSGIVYPNNITTDLQKKAYEVQKGYRTDLTFDKDGNTLTLNTETKIRSKNSENAASYIYIEFTDVKGADLNAISQISATLTSTEKSTGENVLLSLEIMWKGMLSIFLVILVIIVIVIIFNQIDSRKQKEVEKE